MPFNAWCIIPPGPSNRWAWAVSNIAGVVHGVGITTSQVLSQAWLSTPVTEPAPTAAAHAQIRRGRATANSTSAISAMIGQLIASVKPQVNASTSPHLGLHRSNELADHGRDGAG